MFFKDEHVSFKLLFALLLVKAFACCVYYWYYFIYNSHAFGGDSNDTLAGAETLYGAFKNDKVNFFKMVFGLHSNLMSDPLYENYFKNINDWGNSDSTDEFFLNDNRTSIRFHALVRLISNGHYAAHAFVVLAISFVGQFAFYKTFKTYFIGKEKLLLVIIFITPSVLFWSSGVLKEPLAIGILGGFLYCFMNLFLLHKITLKYCFAFVFLFLSFTILKPYILVIVLCPLLLFALVKRFHIKRIILFYAVSLLVVYTASVVALKFIFHKDVVNTIVVRQNDFISLSKGGVFFVNDKNYLRLEYKHSDNYKLTDSINGNYKIDVHAPLMYWDLNNLRDTIFVSDNQDTSNYKLLSINKPAGSGIHMQRLEYSFSSFAKLLPLSFYNVLCKPFFFDAGSAAELVASLENVAILLFFIVCFFYRSSLIVNKNLLCFCVAIVLLSFMLIGITTTVTGAIVRYKVPFIPFLLMIPLLYLDKSMVCKNKFIKWFFCTKA